MENDNYVYPGKRFAKDGLNLGVGQGMNMRDYFAGQALSGWLASYGADMACDASDVAQFAYGVADAMLEARK